MTFTCVLHIIYKCLLSLCLQTSHHYLLMVTMHIHIYTERYCTGYNNKVVLLNILCTTQCVVVYAYTVSDREHTLSDREIQLQHTVAS